MNGTRQQSEERPLSEQEQKKKGGGGRRRRRRRNNNGGQGNQGGNNSGGNRNNNGRRRNRRGPGDGGPRGPRRPIEPYELFAAYYLGLDDNHNYRNQGIREVSRRFGCGQKDIKDALETYKMDKASLRTLRPRFDIKYAELDVKVAPEGIDRGTVARERYDEFVEVALEAGLFSEPPDVSLLAIFEEVEEEAAEEVAEEVESAPARVDFDADDAPVEAEA